MMHGPARNARPGASRSSSAWSSATRRKAAGEGETKLYAAIGSVFPGNSPLKTTAFPNNNWVILVHGLLTMLLVGYDSERYHRRATGFRPPQWPPQQHASQRASQPTRDIQRHTDQFVAGLGCAECAVSGQRHVRHSRQPVACRQ